MELKRGDQYEGGKFAATHGLDDMLKRAKSWRRGGAVPKKKRVVENQEKKREPARQRSIGSGSGDSGKKQYRKYDGHQKDPRGPPSPLR